jgi:hypothetical protein
MERVASADELKRGVGLALDGDWDGAHAIAQQNDSDPRFCWLHACLHKIEGDGSNSRYWYARAGRKFDDFAETDVELRAILAALS